MSTMLLIGRTPAGGEPVGEPRWRRADTNISHGERVPAAAGIARSRPCSGACPGADAGQRQAVAAGRRRLPTLRAPGRARSGIRPVGRDLEVDHVPVDAVDGKAAGGEPTGDDVAASGRSTKSRSHETGSFMARAAPGSAGRSRRTSGCRRRRRAAAPGVRCRRRTRTRCTVSGS